LKLGALLNDRRNQLQWVALLAVAVLLPTVSLLWFLSRVVANERLVIHQKLAALYQDKLAAATARTESLCAARLAILDKIKPGTNPYTLFRRLVLEENFQGVVVWGADGSLSYPRSSEVAGNDAPSDSSLTEAWQLEFASQDFAGAARLYDRYSNDGNPDAAVAAIMGKSRCLLKLGRIGEAINECQKAAFFALPGREDTALRTAVENARLLLLSLLKQSGPSPVQAQAEILHRTVSALNQDLFNATSEYGLLQANQNLFIAKKVLELPQSSSFAGDGKERDRLEKLAAAEELSLAAAETVRPFAGQFDRFFPTDLDEKRFYGLRHRTQSSTLLVLLPATGIASVLSEYQEVFAGAETAYRILDANGNFVAGPPLPEGKAFITADLPALFPGWKVELYFKGGDVFEKAAARQIAVYVWTGVLVIVLVLIASGFAILAVGRQIRLNRMKNDFIATVSHELKTPLASMRVLMDTLLEGNIRDEAQAKEYLRMTARENERLSRIIDNFLTFSRMERHKLAFAVTAAQPAAIASDAIESTRTKFAAQQCHLTVEITEHLPDIQADHDAMVTVLVNLLDNACKYTGDDKRIALKVFAGAGFVCFVVSDNGIGLARRHLRRIFDRFYQVDRSLARKAEGCGLGLSIVKFILDAHNGRIDVESKPGKGSTFTVRIPVSKTNGD
jgi:signal transduction histidine kinase